MNEKRLKMSLREYHNACNDLLELFCGKHEFDYEDAKENWVANEIGGTVCCGDYYFNMDVIVTDLKEDAPEEELIKWYDYSMRCGYLGVTGCNYHSWLKRCPVISEEMFLRLEAAKRKAEEAEEIFRKMLDEVKNQNF